MKISLFLNLFIGVLFCKCCTWFLWRNEGIGNDLSSECYSEYMVSLSVICWMLMAIDVLKGWEI